MSQPAYTVLVDDNFHYMDEEYRYTLGTFKDCESAIKACKRIVDEFLDQNYKPGMTAEQLYKLYIAFGEDPYIIASSKDCSFSAWNYAKQRCTEICRSGLLRTFDAIKKKWTGG